VEGLSSRAALLAILALLLAMGAASGYFAHGSQVVQACVYGVGAWPLYVLTYLWMKADASARSTAPPPGAAPLIPVLLPIAVPYYLLATRRRWHKLLGMVLLLGYISIALAALSIGESSGNRLAAWQGARAALASPGTNRPPHHQPSLEAL
jgi:hypothetical protein